MLPFPNNFYTYPANSTKTGLLLRLSTEGLPVANDGATIDPADWLLRDGFARVLPAATYVPGVSLDKSNLPRQWDIAQSLVSGGPSILLDSVTMEPLAHWTEIDYSSPEAPIEEHVLTLWPIEPLVFGRRYIVAYRQLKTEEGEVIKSSVAFSQLRDHVASDDYDVEGRRDHFEDAIFPLLRRAGFVREELYLAWDFTVASEENTRSSLGHMVKDGLGRLPEDGPEYQIFFARDDFSDVTGRVIYGRFKTPSYRQRDRPGSKLVLDEAGLPVFQRFVWAPFSLTIPATLTSGAAEPRGTIQYGHGLFQNHLVVLSPYLQNASSAGDAVLYATNMIGMSAEDVPAVLEMLNTDLSDASIIPHGVHQGILNFLVLQKLMKGSLLQDERVMRDNVTLINTKNHGYIGYSQGGIYGSPIVALSDEIHEGVFGVPGGPFVQLLPRADPFKTYWQVICNRYKNAIDRFAMLSYIQLLWDLVDPVSYVDLLAANPAKRAQFIWAKGDAQVTYLGNNILARGAKARSFSNFITSRANETQYGFEVVEETVLDDGIITMGYDFGVPETPIWNIPPNKTTDTHDDVYKQSSFVARCLTLFYEKKHRQICRGPCGWDPIEN